MARHDAAPCGVGRRGAARRGAHLQPQIESFKHRAPQRPHLSDPTLPPLVAMEQGRYALEPHLQVRARGIVCGGIASFEQRALNAG